MCELLKNVQKLAKQKELPIPNCPPNVQAVCTGTECALENIIGDTSRALSSSENLNKFYKKLKDHKKIISSSS